MSDADDMDAAVKEHNRRVAETAAALEPVEPAAPARVYVEAKCWTCGALIFSELYRPAVRDNWPAIVQHYQRNIEAHVASCPKA